jgi:hypothetical protein
LRAPYTSDGNRVDPYLFVRGSRRIDKLDLHIGLRQEGSPLDFTFADFDVPVVNQRTKHILETELSSGVSYLPIAIDGIDEMHYVVHVWAHIRCLDEMASGVRYWTEEDGRPEKVGKYRDVSRLVLRESALSAEVPMFRVAGWEVALVANESVISKLIRVGISGVTYLPVDVD